MGQDGQIIFAPMETNRWSATVCGGDIRWKDGRLQQRFVVTDYAGSSPTGSRQEWRDVPTITDDPQ